MKKGIEFIFCVLILCFSLQAKAGKSDRDMDLKYSKDTWTEGSMQVFATENGSKVKSVFTATNGIIISLESTPDKQKITLGDQTLNMTRLGNGSIKVVSEKNGKKRKHIFKKSELQHSTLNNALESADVTGGDMSPSELEAYSQYVNFLEKNNPGVPVASDGSAGANTISGKCVLYVVGTGLTAAASAELCAISFGWGCAGGVAATIMAWDATRGVCGV